MEQKISDYSINLLWLCVLLMVIPIGSLQAHMVSTTRPPSSLQRKNAKQEKADKDEVHYPLYNGISVGIDLWGPASKLFGSDFFSMEIMADVNLKNRFFPTVELGYGSTDSWGETGIHYKSSAPYFRIGMDYNTFYKKKFKHKLLVGVRYAVSSFNYDINSVSVSDPIYGGSLDNPGLIDDIWGGSVPYNHENLKCTMQWLELCAGIRAHIWKDLYMGWAVRYRFKLSASPDRYGDPWYVPGFGQYNDNNIGVTYSITYKLPF